MTALASTPRWYVVHTHPRAELRALAHIVRQGFDAYLPRYLKRRRHARRTDWVRAPLFPRYLFVHMDPAACRWRALRSTVGISHLVGQGDLPTAMPDGVVEDIRRHEDARGNVTLGRQAPFLPGQQVRIVSGPMTDQLGIFEGASDDQRCTLLLELLGRSLRVEVPCEALAHPG